MVVTKNVLKHFFDTSKFKIKKTTKKEVDSNDNTNNDDNNSINSNSKEEVTYQTVYHQDDLINSKSPLSGLQSSEETVRPINIPTQNILQTQLNLNIQSMFNNYQFTNSPQFGQSFGNSSINCGGGGGGDGFLNQFPNQSSVTSQVAVDQQQQEQNSINGDNFEQFGSLTINNSQWACSSQESQFYHTNNTNTNTNQYQLDKLPNFPGSIDSFQNNNTSQSETNSQTSSQANSYYGGSYFEEVMSNGGGGGGQNSNGNWSNVNLSSSGTGGGGYCSSVASSICSNNGGGGFLSDPNLFNPSMLSASLDTYTGFGPADPYNMVSPLYTSSEFGLAQSMTDLSLQSNSLYSSANGGQFGSTPNFHNHPLSPQSFKGELNSPILPNNQNQLDINQFNHHQQIPHQQHQQHLHQAPKYPNHISSKNICPFPGCHKIFSKAYNCSTHYLTHFPNRVRAHVCPVCSRGFDRKYDLGRHMSTKRHHPPNDPNGLNSATSATNSNNTTPPSLEV